MNWQGCLASWVLKGCPGRQNQESQDSLRTPAACFWENVQTEHEKASPIRTLLEISLWDSSFLGICSTSAAPHSDNQAVDPRTATGHPLVPVQAPTLPSPLASSRYPLHPYQKDMKESWARWLLTVVLEIEKWRQNYQEFKVSFISCLVSERRAWATREPVSRA